MSSDQIISSTRIIKNIFFFFPFFYFRFVSKLDCQWSAYGLTIGDWLNGGAIEWVVEIIMIWFYILYFGREKTEKNGTPLSVLTMRSFYNIVWFLWGITILLNSDNQSCSNRNEVMTVVVLILISHAHSIPTIKYTTCVTEENANLPQMPPTLKTLNCCQEDDNVEIDEKNEKFNNSKKLKNEQVY